MKKNLSLFMSFCAMGLYCLLFGGIFLAITFKNVIFTYRLSFQLVLLSGLVIAFGIFMAVYKKIDHILIQHRYKILAVVCLFMLAVQTVISLNMVPTVLYDHEKTLNAAIIYTLQGNSADFQLYNNYLHHYPHQMGIFLLQHSLFNVVPRLGIENFFMTACITGHLLFTAMIVTGFKYLDENFSSHAAIFYLLLAAVYLPIYFQSSISYTDTWSAWAPACLLLYGTRALKTEDNKKRIFYSALTGLLAGIAMQIKTTALIVLVALAIQRIVKGVKKKDLCVAVILLAVIMVTNTAFDKWSYSTVLEEYRDGESMPLTHWVMMGLQGDGSYSGYDEWEITCSVPPEERVALNMKVIKERLEEMGPTGYLKLLYTKTCRTFGSGNADLRYSFLYAENIQPEGILYNLVLENGSLYSLSNNISHAVYLFINLVAVIGCGIMLIKKHKDIFRFAPQISLIGFWIFMMLWESNHRQLINQWSLFLMVGAIGIGHIYNLLFGKNKR